MKPSKVDSTFIPKRSTGEFDGYDATYTITFQGSVVTAATLIQDALMARDRFVQWGDSRPSREDILSVLGDYVRGLASDIEWQGDRYFVNFPGRLSFPFQRTGPATEALRAAWQEQSSTDSEDGINRWFEVWLGDDCIDVITRGMDEITNVLADGFAKVCARGWNGKLTDV